MANVVSSTFSICIFSLACMRLSSCCTRFVFLVLAHATVRHSFST